MDVHANLKQTLQVMKEWFWDWRTSVESLTKLSEANRVLRSAFPLQGSAFVTHREAKGLREIWILAKCAAAMNIDGIKLNQHDPPDGYVRRDTLVSPAEVLEVIEPGRKRNLEFSPGAPEWVMDPGEKWARRAEQIPGALRAGIEKKRGKVYPEGTELFVYLNIDEYGIRQKAIETQIRTILSEDIRPLEAIHVLWKRKVYSADGMIHEEKSEEFDSVFDDESLFDEVLGVKDDD